MSKTQRESFEICGIKVAAGSRGSVEIPVAQLYNSSPVTIPVRVIHGVKPGPVVFVSAALHGDEINGVEIIRRVMTRASLKKLSGTLIFVPVVNTLAFIHQSRYTPDRRDLNRSFPGSETGSLAARLAFRFIHEVVSRADYGIDLHTGAVHRPNLPQIRANLADAESLRLAKAFGAPLLLNSSPTAGTLRDYTTKMNIPVLLYEAAEALRFDETSIRIGVDGVLNVLRAIGMLPERKVKPSRKSRSVLAQKSSWVRASTSGVLRPHVNLGEKVSEGQLLGIISDPLGDHDTPVNAASDGVVIGRLVLPLVHEGDALFHIARVAETEDADRVGNIHQAAAEPAVGSSGEPAIV